MENCMLLSSDRVCTCEGAGSDTRVGRQELDQDFILSVEKAIKWFWAEAPLKNHDLHMEDGMEQERSWRQSLIHSGIVEKKEGLEL